jgi:hypothetical protein
MISRIGTAPSPMAQRHEAVSLVGEAHAVVLEGGRGARAGRRPGEGEGRLGHREGVAVSRQMPTAGPAASHMAINSAEPKSWWFSMAMPDARGLGQEGKAAEFVAHARRLGPSRGAGRGRRRA